MSDEYEERRQRRREEERRYEMDTMYEVWRSGGNTDRIDYERVDGHFEIGDDSGMAASDELHRQRQKPETEEDMPDENY